jgi:peptide chain release factor 1
VKSIISILNKKLKKVSLIINSPFFFKKIKEEKEFYIKKYALLENAKRKISQFKKSLKKIDYLIKTQRKERTNNDLELLKIIKDELVNETFIKNNLLNKIKTINSKIGSILFKKKYKKNSLQNYSNNKVIIEIRAGIGGDEASLFVKTLYKMYEKYSEMMKFKFERLNFTISNCGGFKEIIFSILGNFIFHELKYESGVHRVQRIPVTESGGRIHTSTATVAVLREAREIDVKIEQNDLNISICRSGGPGGQSVNTTDSSVRIVHKPTGILACCSDERSQIRNKEKAMRVLRSRILELEQEKKRKECQNFRKNQIGWGKRSEKIRTYNFPKNRVTDHRIRYTFNCINKFVNGNIQKLLDKLKSKIDI